MLLRARLRARWGRDYRESGGKVIKKAFSRVQASERHMLSGVCRVGVRRAKVMGCVDSPGLQRIRIVYNYRILVGGGGGWRARSVCSGGLLFRGNVHYGILYNCTPAARFKYIAFTIQQS